MLSKDELIDKYVHANNVEKRNLRNIIKKLRKRIEELEYVIHSNSK